MFTSNATQEFKQTLKQFEAETRAESGGYAFGCGYFESLCADMFAVLPKRLQKEFQEQMTYAVSKFGKEVVK
jgi:hypothetical protein